MTNVKLYGSKDCKKSRLYQDALTERKIDYVFLDVEANQDAASELRLLYSDGSLKFPTLLIGTLRLRNPSLRDLDRKLAHEGLYNPGAVHEPKSNRFVRYMKPEDAFLSYSETQGRLILGHIEVPPQSRGTGLGARFALEVFPMVKALGKEARITCPFMRKVASKHDEWAEYFNVPRSA